MLGTVSAISDPFTPHDFNCFVKFPTIPDDGNGAEICPRSDRTAHIEI